MEKEARMRDMEWIECLNQTINYMEEHLTGEIAYEELTRLTCCSTYHHQRMFGYMVGASLSEYIRHRRMPLAAVDLSGGEEKIVDLALEYDYLSLTTFNRAFQSVHGIAPSAVKKDGANVRAYPPINFKITVKGVEEMNYRIENREGIRIVGIFQPLHKEIGKNFEVVPQMWGKAAMDGTILRLAGMVDGQPMGLLGVNVCGEEENWRYFIAVASSTLVEDGLEEYRTPTSIWAVFSGSGINLSIQGLERRTVAGWLPTSGYEYGNASDIEVYLNLDPVSAQPEMWTPVGKK